MKKPWTDRKKALIINGIIWSVIGCGLVVAWGQDSVTGGPLLTAGLVGLLLGLVE